MNVIKGDPLLSAFPNQGSTRTQLIPLDMALNKQLTDALSQGNVP